jgi:hypothetical protein
LHKKISRVSDFSKTWDKWINSSLKLNPNICQIKLTQEGKKKPEHFCIPVFTKEVF